MSRYIIEEVFAPGECLFRFDASQYPGGDYECHKKDIKCPDEYRFPKKCPLKLKP